jgi:hypothetical protein
MADRRACGFRGLTRITVMFDRICTFDGELWLCGSPPRMRGCWTSMLGYPDLSGQNAAIRTIVPVLGVSRFDL